MTETLDLLVMATLFFVMLESYLTANKLWRRKHKKDVAESISLSARTISVVTLTMYIIDSYSQSDVKGMVSALVWFAVVLFQMMIGAGFWVRDVRQLSLGKRLRLFLRKEAHEASDLITAAFRPGDTEQLFRILSGLALIDDHLDDKEHELLNVLLDEWQLSADWNALKAQRHSEASLNFVTLREELCKYLDVSPPEREIRRLAELIQLLSSSDGHVSGEESLMINELLEMIQGHLSREAAAISYEVAIVPRNDQHGERIQVLLPDLHLRKREYGPVFASSPLFTKRFAELLCAEYRQLGFAAMVVEANHA